MGFSEVLIYRTQDLQIVRRWRLRGGDIPALAFLNERSVMQLNEHSRVSFYEW
jgi:hypothetical protein